LPGAPHHHLAHDGDFRPEEAAWEPHVTALAKSVSTNSRDQSRYSAIVDPALKLMIDAVQRYDGYVVRSTGDGIFAIFGATVAHEDHPQRALYAGLRMQEELRRYGSKLQAEGRAPIEIRGMPDGPVLDISVAC